MAINFNHTNNCISFTGLGISCGYFIDNLHTGDFITTSMTGAFGVCGSIDLSNYVSTSMTGNLVSTSMTGNLVSTSMTGILSNLQKGIFGNNIKVAGIDYPSIQQTINSITDASFSNNYTIIVPPPTGRFWCENLNFKGGVHLLGLSANDNQTVQICGYHTFTGSCSVIGNNKVSIQSLTFINTGVLPTFCIYSSGIRNEFCFNNIYLQDSYTGLTLKNIIYASSGSVLYFDNSTITSTRGAYLSSISGACGAFISPVNINSTLYLHCANAYIKNGSYFYGINAAIKITGAGMTAGLPYLEIRNSQIESSGYCSGAPVIRVDNGLTLIGSSSITNISTTGNGLFISSGATVGSFGNNFTIAQPAGSTSGYYAINGHTGTFGGYYVHANNMYSCVPALGLLYNTKYKLNLNQVTYPTGITSQA